MKRKLLSTILCMALATGLLSGCGGKETDGTADSTGGTAESVEEAGGDTAAAGGENADAQTDGAESTGEQKFEKTVTLSYLTWTYADRTDSTDKWIDDCLERFNIKIELQNAPGDDYFTTFKAKMAADELPDLVGVHSITPRYETASTQIKEDTFIDVSDLENVGKYPQEVLDTLKINGKLFYVPTTQNTMGVLYNKTVFEENGLSVPGNYEEFVSVMETLKGAGTPPLAGSFADAWTAQIIPFIAFDSYVLRNDPDVAKKLYDVETNESTLRWSDLGEGIDKTLGLTKEWIDAGYFSNDPIGTDANTACQLLATGKAAMFITGCWEYSVAAQAAEDPSVIGFFPLPLNEPEEELILPVTASEGICINSASENLEAAKIALNYYLSEEIQELVIAEVGGLPLNSQLEATDEFSQEVIDSMDNCRADMNGFYSRSAAGYMLPKASSFNRPDELASLAGGYSTPEEFCQRADAAVAEIADIK